MGRIKKDWMVAAQPEMTGQKQDHFSQGLYTGSHFLVSRDQMCFFWMDLSFVTVLCNLDLSSVDKICHLWIKYHIL